MTEGTSERKPMAEPIFFLILAVVAIAAAIKMITSTHPVHSALYLVLNFACVAVLYVLLRAPFVAVVQVAVYAGAIMVLFLFIIMYLSFGPAQDVEPHRTRRWAAILVPLFIGLFIVGAVARRGGPLCQPYWDLSVQPVDISVQAVGQALFTKYLLPFEIASVILLVAMVGIIVIARPRAE
jgi:NADH-quinone oxidoreductase subunit J